MCKLQSNLIYEAYRADVILAVTFPNLSRPTSTCASSRDQLKLRMLPISSPRRSSRASKSGTSLRQLLFPLPSYRTCQFPWTRPSRDCQF